MDLLCLFQSGHDSNNLSLVPLRLLSKLLCCGQSEYTYDVAVILTVDIAITIAAVIIMRLMLMVIACQLVVCDYGHAMTDRLSRALSWPPVFIASFALVIHKFVMTVQLLLL